MEKPIYIGKVAAPPLITETGRAYAFDAAMRQAAERASFQPKLNSISTKTSNFRYLKD